MIRKLAVDRIRGDRINGTGYFFACESTLPPFLRSLSAAVGYTRTAREPDGESPHRGWPFPVLRARSEIDEGEQGRDLHECRDRPDGPSAPQPRPSQ